MRAWEITKKDLRLLVRDRRTLAVLLVLPLILIAIIGGSTGRLLGWQKENQQLKILIVEETRSELADKVVKTLSGRDGLAITRVQSHATATQMINDGEAIVAMVIGPKFPEKVEALELSDILNPNQGRLAEGMPGLDIAFESKPSYASTSAIVGQLVFADTLRTLVPHVARKNKLVARYVDRLEKSAAEEPAPPRAAAPADSKSQAAKNDQVFSLVVPSYTVMFVFFLLNIMARSFIAEREMGTLRRLRIAPITPPALLLGKTIPFFIISIVQSVLLFLFGKLLFGMSWGSEPWMLLPIMVTTSMAATSLGLLVSTLVRTDQQVSAYANFLVLTLAGVSGCFMPRDWLPPMMQKLSLATPHAWALIAYQNTLLGDTVNHRVVAQCCAMLVAFAAVFFSLGWWRFRHFD